MHLQSPEVEVVKMKINLKFVWLVCVYLCVYVPLCAHLVFVFLFPPTPIMPHLLPLPSPDCSATIQTGTKGKWWAISLGPYEADCTVWRQMTANWHFTSFSTGGLSYEIDSSFGAAVNVPHVFMERIWALLIPSAGQTDVILRTVLILSDRCN